MLLGEIQQYNKIAASAANYERGFFYA
jgi:hypothetical protein